jgi:hypothetical protein
VLALELTPCWFCGDGVDSVASPLVEGGNEKWGP